MLSPTTSRAILRLAGLAAVLALLGTTSGCSFALGPFLSSNISSTNERSESATIDSEPQGARITKDGVFLGTTPATLAFTYQAEETKSHGHCWLPFTLGFVDLGIGAGTLWAGVRHWDRNVGVMLTGVFWGGLGFLFGEVYGLACLADPVTTDIKPVPRVHTLSLSSGGAEQSLVVRVPLGPKETRISTVIQGREEADWQKTKELDTAAAYQAYLTRYPSGRWWKAARDGVEDLAWRRAKAQDTVSAYEDYLANYPKGRWEQQAQDRLEQPTWEQARKQDTSEAYWRYLRRYPSGKWKTQAEAALENVFWREAQRKNTVKAYKDFLERYPSGGWQQGAVSAIERILQADPRSADEGTLDALLLNPRWGHQGKAAKAYLQRGEGAHLTKTLDASQYGYAAREGILKGLNEVAAASPHPEGKAALVSFLCAFASSHAPIESVPPANCEKVEKCDRTFELSLAAGYRSIDVYCTSGRVQNFTGEEAATRARLFVDSSRAAAAECERGEKARKEEIAEAGRLRGLAREYCGGAHP